MVLMQEASTLRILPSKLTLEDKLAYHTQVAVEIAKMKTNRIAHMQNLLIRLGVPTHLRGYWYLTWMLEYMLMECIELDYTTRYLYPEVAKQFGVKAAAVERDVRYLLRWTWINGDSEQLVNFSGNTNGKAPGNLLFMRIFYNHVVYAERAQEAA